MPITAGQAVGAGVAASASAGLLSYGLNALAASKQYSRMKQMMKKGPSLQMEGLRRAGLNPILAAGAGIKGGPLGSAQQAHAAQMGSGSNVGLQALQANQARTAANLNTAGTAKITAETNILDSQRVYEAGRAAFYSTPEGIKLIKDEAYKNSIPDTMTGNLMRMMQQMKNVTPGSAKNQRHIVPPNNTYDRHNPEYNLK